MENKNIYDIFIIGAGPAGLTAGFYAGRANFKTILVEKLAAGGQMIIASIIDNYPAFPDGTSGYELQQRLFEQTKKFNVQFQKDEIEEIEKKDDIFVLKSKKTVYYSYSVIIATGAHHRYLSIPGEKKFVSRGVSYCGTCDGPFFKNKNVYVIGGGDTALSESIFLAKFANSVTIVHRRDRFRAVNSLVKQAQNTANIHFVFNTIAREIKGENFVQSIILKDLVKDEQYEAETDGVFIFVGLDPSTQFIRHDILDDAHYIKTDIQMKTKYAGIFAAGDVRSGTFRQIVCATADGAKAAFYAGEYVDELKGETYQ